MVQVLDVLRTIMIGWSVVLCSVILLVVALYWDAYRRGASAHAHVFLVAVSYAVALIYIIADQTNYLGHFLTFRLPMSLVINVFGSLAMWNLWQRHKTDDFGVPDHEEGVT